MIKPEDFVHSLVPHNKQYQRKTLLPSLLYEPLKWRMSSQFTDSEVRATFWRPQDFVSRRESLKRPFPHSCEQTHQLEAPVGKLQ